MVRGRGRGSSTRRATQSTANLNRSPLATVNVTNVNATPDRRTNSVPSAPAQSRTASVRSGKPVLTPRRRHNGNESTLGNESSLIIDPEAEELRFQDYPRLGNLIDTSPLLHLFGNSRHMSGK